MEHNQHPLAAAIRDRGGQPSRLPLPARIGTLLSLGAAQAYGAGVSHNIEVLDNSAAIATNGSTHTITNASGGSNPVNVFKHFVVGTGNTVNLQLPTGANQLVNIVRDSQPAVHGILNSYQNGSIGGNVVFASSHGFLVGSSGVVNVGKLTVRTPSSSDLEDFIDGSKSTTQLINNDFSVSSSGVVSIAGKINSKESVDINADQVTVSSGAVINTGNTLNGNYIASYDAAVNTGDYDAPKALQNDGGTIKIVAAGQTSGDAITLGGDLLADGGITIEAEEITITADARLDTRNKTTTTADGDISLTAKVTDKVGQGQSTATTKITIGGELHGNNITATAQSKSVASYDNDLGAWVGTVAVGAFSGVTFNYVAADADATLTIESSADINAKNSVSLSTHALAEADDPIIGLNGNAIIGAAAVYADVDATSTTHVKSGAKISAGGNIDITAHNEAYLNATSMTVVATDSNNIVASVAVGEAQVDSTAKVDSGVTLAAENLNVSAQNHNSFYVSSSSYGFKNTKIGASVAYGNFNTNSIAELGSGITINSSGANKGDVAVSAIDRTYSQRVHSSTTVGSSLLFRTIGAPAVAALGAVQSGVNSLTSSLLPKEVTSMFNSSGNNTTLKFGFSLALSEANKNAFSFIGNNTAGGQAPNINTTGNVTVASLLETLEYRTSSESGINAPSQSNNTSSAKNGASLGLNFTMATNTAIAEIGDHTTISANRLGVGAWQYQPITSTYDRWDTFSDVVSKLNANAGLANNLLTSYANAAGEADEFSLAGSFNYLDVTHNTKAWVGDYVDITTTATDDSWDLTFNYSLESSNQAFKNLFDYHGSSHTETFQSAVAVAAYNKIQSISIGGNFGAFLILSGNGTNEDGTSVGASVSYVDFDTHTIAGIGNETKITSGSGDVSVSAITDDLHVVVAPTSGVGSGFAFNGIAAVLGLDNTTHASLHKGSNITADEISVNAQQLIGNWSASGAIAYTDAQAVGIAIAINETLADTQAYIGDNSSSKAKVSWKNPLPPPYRPQYLRSRGGPYHPSGSGSSLQQWYGRFSCGRWSGRFWH